jgi:hypothetical protein
MSRIETEKKISPNSIEALFGFLTDMNNYEQLMPQDKIEKWSASVDKCEFTIKGMARIGLEKVEEQPHELIKISSFGKVPFPFELQIHLTELAEKQTQVYMVFDGEINPFMKLMVEKPLKNFFNMLVDKATELNL